MILPNFMCYGQVRVLRDVVKCSQNASNLNLQGTVKVEKSTSSPVKQTQKRRNCQVKICIFKVSLFLFKILYASLKEMHQNFHQTRSQVSNERESRIQTDGLCFDSLSRAVIIGGAQLCAFLLISD